MVMATYIGIGRRYRFTLATVIVCSVLYIIATFKQSEIPETLSAKLSSRTPQIRVETDQYSSLAGKTNAGQNETYQPQQPRNNLISSEIERFEFRKFAKINISNELTPQKAEELFYEFILQKHITCKTQKRFGRKGDGGWNVCIDAPFALYSPCTVYSFGINNDWSFDDAVSKDCGCKVRAFDPSMKVNEHARSELVYFWKKGIAGTNRINSKGWTLETLGKLLKDIGDSDTIIDFLKIDVEYNEWEMFEGLFKENSLRKVKQFAFEIHTYELFKGSTTVSQFVKYWTALKTLEDLGFRRWYCHLNPFGKYTSNRTSERLSCCYELAYVNVNFIGQ